MRTIRSFSSIGITKAILVAFIVACIVTASFIGYLLVESSLAIGAINPSGGNSATTTASSENTVVEESTSSSITTSTDALASTSPLWPMLHSDPQNSGRSDFSSGAQNGSLLWSFDTGAWTGADGSMVIGSDGTIYHVLYGESYNNISQLQTFALLQALDPNNGGLKWTAHLSYASDVLIGNNPNNNEETIYAGPYFSGINPETGNVEWNYSTTPFGFLSTTMSNDGKTIYEYTGGYPPDDSFDAISALNGSVEWTFSPHLWADHECGTYGISPAVGPDGTIYFQSNYCGVDLIALNPDGTLKWEITSNSSVAQRLPQGCGIGDIYVGPDGTVYAASNYYAETGLMGQAQACPPVLFALSQTNGSLKWSINGVRYVAIGVDGTIYASPALALNPDGSTKWNVTSNLAKCGMGATVNSSSFYSYFLSTSPVVGKDGTFYTASDNGTVCAINSKDGSLRWSLQLPDHSPTLPDYFGMNGCSVALLAIGRNDTLYAQSDEGWIYSIG